MLGPMKHTVWVVALLSITVHADPKSKAPHGAKHIAIDYTWQSFSRDERHYKLDWNGSQYKSDKAKLVDAKLVAALYDALSTATREVPDELQCISHTDDYPAFTIKIDGDEPISITSRSNCHAYVPWNLKKDGKVYAQFDGNAWRALAPILAGLDGKWHANEPMATTSTGGEMVGLGQYARNGQSNGDAAVCAHSFETNAQARQLFGDPIVIDEAAIGCDLGSSPDCSSDIAEARFAVDGLSAQIDFACTNGTASIAQASVALYRDLRRFLASKPVRVLVKHASADSPPRVWNNGSWSIEGDANMPMLDWDPRGTTISASAMGQPIDPTFWRELGIDPKPLTKQENGYAELKAKLDFSGKLVK
jgi:hypothetical protein